MSPQRMGTRATTGTDARKSARVFRILLIVPRFTVVLNRDPYKLPKATSSKIKCIWKIVDVGGALI